MTAKRVSQPRKRPATTKASAKAKTPESALTGRAVLVILESNELPPSGVARVDPEVRRQLIAAEAYFRAERRGFAAGHELSDWLAAEAAVDSQFSQLQVA